MTGRRLPPRHWALRPTALSTGLGLGGLLLTGCSTPAGTGQPTTPQTTPAQVGQPVEVAQASLDDNKTVGQNGQTSWTTTWRVCFKPGRVDTTRWEAQRVTTEGSGASLRELKGRCLEVGVALGQNKADAGMVGRETQLAEAATLAYRVRAVHDDGTVTPWSVPIPAGSTKP